MTTDTRRIFCTSCSVRCRWTY
ncbi:uncharacterized protein DMAD_05612 [Drosophila madeirensis]|uniref:Uncharacterized protein n=1 Tax=Drosophila madeirensis TaxID=30013 RepID=A0AAU9FMK2_DROMD